MSNGVGHVQNLIVVELHSVYIASVYPYFVDQTFTRRLSNGHTTWTLDDHSRSRHDTPPFATQCQLDLADTLPHVTIYVTLTGRLTLRNVHGVVSETDLPGRMGRMVLARLALAHHPVGRFELIDDLWPHGAPPAAESVLNATLSRLRQVLSTIAIDGKNALLSSNGVLELRLPLGSRVDINACRQAFDSAEASLRRHDFARAWSQAVVAQAIARRPFLPGLDRFWIDIERNRLRHLHERSLQMLIDVWTSLGDTRQAVNLCRELVSCHPFSEDSHRRLVMALLDGGDKAAAMDAVTRWEELAERELGLRPDNVLRNLVG